MMKSTIKYSVFSVMISLALVSCSEDFLETKPTSAITEANYIRNVEELESMLFASYSRLCAYYDTYPPANLSIFLFGLGNIGSDDSEKGGVGDWDAEWFQEISLSYQNPDNLTCLLWWILNYGLIESCNVVLDNTEKLLEDPDLDAEQIELIADQARYLRAFGYYHLVTMFGDVPLRTTRFDPNDPFMERTKDSLVWVQIEQDLNEAVDLPLRSESQFGRVTHGAAYSLLGKSYMWQEKYPEAIDAYMAIIESGQYRLVDEFGLIHRWEGEDCDESIFEFQNALGVDGGDIADWAAQYRMPRDLLGGGWGFDNPTQDLVDEYEEGDPRLMYTVIFKGDVFPTPFGEYVVENNSSYTGYMCRKAWLPYTDQTRGPGWDHDYNWRFSRYAEVLLFCAEALNEDGQPNRAKEYLNMVRKRARETTKIDPERISTVWDSTYTGELLPDVTTSDQAELREAIWHEQRVELAMEAHRRWILLRTGRFKEAMERAKGAKGCTVEDHEWLLPIHFEEIEATKGTIEQNPGY